MYGAGIRIATSKKHLNKEVLAMACKGKGGKSKGGKTEKSGGCKK